MCFQFLLGTRTERFPCILATALQLIFTFFFLILEPYCAYFGPLLIVSDSDIR